MSLDGQLTKESQNLIFARNGTGKSFLSRAFRCLDLYGDGKDVSDAPRNLVSDEASDGTGKFTFLRGTQKLGEISLCKRDGVLISDNDSTIFHVFSEVKWSGKTGQRAKMYPTLKTGYTNDQETQFFGQV